MRVAKGNLFNVYLCHSHRNKSGTVMQEILSTSRRTEEIWYPPGQKNIHHKPLVDPSKVFLPPLHIKLGLLQNLCQGH